MKASSMFLLTLFALCMFIFSKEAEAKKPPKHVKKTPIAIEAAQANLNKALSGESFVFRQNSGQWEQPVLFRTFQGNHNVSFLIDRVSFGVKKMKSADEPLPQEPGKAVPVLYNVWEIQFLNTQKNSSLSGTELIQSNVTYFGPNNASGNHVAEYNGLVYHEIYKGISAKFYTATTGSLKYDFLVAPHASPGNIALRYNGVQQVKVNVFGQLEIQTSEGIFKEDKPVAWQIINGIKHFVKAAFKINADGSVGFDLGKYNPDCELVIDPVYVDWSSYFYGKPNINSFAFTWILDIDIDFSDQVYITGSTTEYFPFKPGAYDTTLVNYDAFIAKMTADGDSIFYFSYLGGSSWEYGLSLAVNNQNQPVISGLTWSNDFPVTKGAYDTSQKSCTGTWCLKSFVTKFNSTGTSLVFSTYLGGKSGSGFWNLDWIRGMILNSNGDIYIVGNTTSYDYPVTTGCFQKDYNGGAQIGNDWASQGDGFLTKMRADGTGLVFSTFIGGTNGDVCQDVFLTASEEVYVVGYTASTNFPLTAGAPIFNTYLKGKSDAFFMKFKANGNQMLYSHLMGGSGEDVFEGMYVNDKDEPFVAGYSNSSDFPTSKNAYQKSNAGGYDFVVVKMPSSGTNVYYSTYLGGSANEYLFSYPFFSTIKIAANVREEAIICGISRSKNYPITTDALQSTNKSSINYGTLTMAKISMAGDKLLYGTYYGGSYLEYPGGIKVRRTGCVTNIIFGGLTYSKDYPTTKGAYKDSARYVSSGWTYSGFVSKFRDTLQVDLIALSLEDTIIECDNVFEILDASNQGANFLWSHGPKTRFVILEDTGTYWVQATYGCDTVRDTISLKLEYSPKVPVFAGDTLFCDQFLGMWIDAKNDSILRKYLWNTNETRQRIFVSDTGFYKVQIATPHCGTAEDSILIKLLNTPVVKLPDDTLFCDSVYIILNGQNLKQESHYLWSTGDTVEMIMVNKPGLVSLTVSNSCGSDSDQVLFERNFAPTVKLPNDTTYCGNYSFTLKVGKPDNDETYNWTDPINKTSLSTADSFDIFNLNGAVAIQIANQCGTVGDSLYLTNLNLPVKDLIDTIFQCSVVNASVQTGNPLNKEIYIWSNGSVTPKTTLVTPGIHWVKIDNYCGSVSDSVLVILKQVPTIELGNDTIFCTAVNWSKNADINDNEANYLWNTGSKNQQININLPGTYKVLVINRCGVFEDSVNVQLIQNPVVDLGPEVVYCAVAEPTTFAVGKAGNLESYSWSTGETTPSITTNLPGMLKVKINNRCLTVEDSVMIRVSPNPIVDLGPDTILCGNFRVLLDAGNAGMEYIWEPQGQNTQTIQATVQTMYKVTVKNADGCVGSDDYKIGDNCISRYYVPNAFTPDGNYKNETFGPILENFENYNMIIFNRWGERIFETTDYTRRWDGTYMGKACVAGNYFYIINIVTTEELVHRQLKGTITLLR
jgi:gliding motility-associated-like protein